MPSEGNLNPQLTEGMANDGGFENEVLPKVDGSGKDVRSLARVRALTVIQVSFVLFRAFIPNLVVLLVRH